MNEKDETKFDLFSHLCETFCKNTRKLMDLCMSEVEAKKAVKSIMNTAVDIITFNAV